MSAADVVEAAAKLTKVQRELTIGRYDDDFTSHSDAATLERLGIWTTVLPDDEDGFERFDVTQFGLVVRAHLLSEEG